MLCPPSLFVLYRCESETFKDGEFKVCKPSKYAGIRNGGCQTSVDCGYEIIRDKMIECHNGTCNPIVME